MRPRPKSAPIHTHKNAEHTPGVHLVRLGWMKLMMNVYLSNMDYASVKQVTHLCVKQSTLSLFLVDIVVLFTI